MDLDLLDLDTPAAPDAHTAAGLAHAARGDWHAADSAFAGALDAAESLADGDATLAAALTNLGQARAYLGALGEAEALLARSVAVRASLVARGEATTDVTARGLMNLAAVQAAAGRRAAARDTLRRAATLTTDVALARAAAEGLALLDDDGAPEAGLLDLDAPFGVIG